MGHETYIEEVRINNALYDLSKKCKNQDEYREGLKEANIKFIEISFGNSTIIIPEIRFNRMKQYEKNKLLKYMKG